jgi:hypothetical protein
MDFRRAYSAQEEQDGKSSYPAEDQPDPATDEDKPRKKGRKPRTKIKGVEKSNGAQQSQEGDSSARDAQPTQAEGQTGPADGDMPRRVRSTRTRRGKRSNEDDNTTEDTQSTHPGDHLEQPNTAQQPQEDDNSTEDTQPTHPEDHPGSAARDSLPIFTRHTRHDRKIFKESKRAQSSQADANDIPGVGATPTAGGDRLILPKGVERTRRHNRLERESWTPADHEQYRLNQLALVERQALNEANRERVSEEKAERERQILKREADAEETAHLHARAPN